VFLSNAPRKLLFHALPMGQGKFHCTPCQQVKVIVFHPPLIKNFVVLDNILKNLLSSSHHLNPCICPQLTPNSLHYSYQIHHATTLCPHHGQVTLFPTLSPMPLVVVSFHYGGFNSIHHFFRSLIQHPTSIKKIIKDVQVLDHSNLLLGPYFNSFVHASTH
jgi:hypothetical protein